MQLYRTLDQWHAAAPGPTSLCIGVFDGVHRGHQMLLAGAREHGARDGLPALVLTFSTHPLSVLAPPYAPPLLTTAEDKAALLERYGADLCLMLDFTAALAATPPRTFLEEIVAGACRARHLVCGRDFRFGAKGAGDVALIEAMAGELGLALDVRDDLLDDATPVRSSRVRGSLLGGDVALAGRLLGRPYRLGGVVVGGDRRGRTIGFPTANIEPPKGRLVPHNGVYAAEASVGDMKYGAMVNIGVRPTFGGERRTVEAHLFDFSGDLYGKNVDLDLRARIRDEQRFAGIEALVAQLRRDAAAARGALSSARDPESA